MSEDYEIVGDVATILNPELFATWPYRQDFIDAMSQGATETESATRCVVMEFEAALGRCVREGTVDEDIDAILARFTSEDYRQHDPNIGDGREPLARFFRSGGFGNTPPPPVAVIACGELVCLMMQLPLPDPLNPGTTYDLFLQSVFRVRDHKLVEHWAPRPKEPGASDDAGSASLGKVAR